MRHILRPVLFRISCCLFVVAAAMTLGSTAIAVSSPLNPGSTVYNPALFPPFPFFTPNYVSGPLPANYALVTTFNVPYDYNGTLNNAFSGFVTTSVYRKTTDSTLAFTYVFNNLAPFPGAPLTDIVRATINDPTDPWSFNQATGMPFQITAAGADPISGGQSTPINGVFGGWNNGMPFDVTRSATDGGIAVEFNPLNSGTQLDSTPNDHSALIWFTTDAKRFAPTNVSFSDNGHVGTAQAYGPSNFAFPFCPEPSTFIRAILGSCGGVLAIWRGRIL
jgi:hypothetical protein